MKKGMKSAFAATLALTACFGGISAYAAHDENLNVYTLDTVVVEADKTKNKFGDTITEQSYYRTGGDVKVITREELDKRHYTDVTEAIKRIPGITFQNPGYRGGEYGYQFYNNGISINGDTRWLSWLTAAVWIMRPVPALILPVQREASRPGSILTRLRIWKMWTRLK